MNRTQTTSTDETTFTLNQLMHPLKKKLNIHQLTKSLRYRPRILKIILSLRRAVKEKNVVIAKLKSKLREQSKSCSICSARPESNIEAVNTGEVKSKDNEIKEQIEIPTNIFEQQVEICDKPENSGWKLKENGDNSKSILDQVKEAAESAMVETGMVYVESAGMYYDYKTGYYYNSELGLYYHPTTNCYYHYSEGQFTFHSYPDSRGQQTNAAYALHIKKQAKKRKKEEEDKNADTSTDETIKRKKRLKDKKQLKDKKTARVKKRSKDKKKAKEHKKAKDKAKRTKAKKLKGKKRLAKRRKQEESLSSSESEHRKKSRKTGRRKISKSRSKEESSDSEEEWYEMKKNGDSHEDGECSRTESENEVEISSSSTITDDESVPNHHPPCMRVIVRETDLPKLKVGSLFLVTKDGGTLGREGETHAILIKDVNVSRTHLDIRYDEHKRGYTVMDLGSKNGTILNGTRMSPSMKVSPHLDVPHGSVIQVGETKLLCHIHPGTDTCGHCEPGLIIEDSPKQPIAYTRTCSKQKQYELELARLKNMYKPQPLAIEDGSYRDRAQERRENIGSTHESEKTQQTDINTSIATEDNKGMQMMKKMGWSKGEGLGREGQGDTEPIPLVSNEKRAGLGAAGSASQVTTAPAMKIAGPRLKSLKPPASVFRDPLEDDD